MKKWLVPLLLAIVFCIGFMPVKVLADTAEVTYLEYDTVQKKMVEKSITSYSLMSSMGIHSGMNEIGTYGATSYIVVDQDLSYDSSCSVYVEGTVYMILKDGVSLTVNGGFVLDSYSSLIIYGQTEGTGSLTVDKPENIDAIYMKDNTKLKIHGGVINLTGRDYYGGIACELNDHLEVDIYNGTITAIGGNHAAGIGGSRGLDINIYGGIITSVGGEGDEVCAIGECFNPGVLYIEPGLYVMAGIDADHLVYEEDYPSNRNEEKKYCHIEVEPWKLLQDAIASDESFSCDQFKSIVSSGSKLIEIREDIRSYDKGLGALVIPSDANIAIRLNGHKIDRALSRAIADGYVIKVENGGHLTIYDDDNSGKITGGNNLESGGGIYNDGGVLSLILATVDGNKARKGGGIYNNEGSVMLAGAVISNNTASSSGGGIYTKNGSVQTNYINNKITENNANAGGGILNDGGNVSLTSTELSNNTATEYGGAIVASGFVGFTNSTIKECSALLGGGVLVYSGARFEAVGGEIKDCTATGTDACGGAVFVQTGGVATFADNIKISGCSAIKDGGGIYAGDAVGFANAAITDCTVTDGNGAGIYLCNGAHVFLGQAAKITGNKKGTADNNLYVAEGGLVTLGTGADVPAPSTGMNIGVTLENANEFVTNDATGCEGYFTPDDDDYVVVLTADKTLLITLLYTVSFNMNGHGTQISSQNVILGDKAAKPSDPSATGYIFEGWCLNIDGKPAFDFDTEITEDTELIAKWKEVDPLPPTGDTNYIFICLAILMISGCALATAELKRKHN